MKYLFHFRWLLLLLVGRAATAQATTKTCLADNSTIFPNPERGFSADRRANHAGEALGLGDLQGVRAGGISLGRRLHVLQDFLGTSISPAYLNMVAADVREDARDALARRVTGTDLRITAGWNNVRLPLGPLPGGGYSVSIQRGAERTVRRLVVAAP